MAAGVGPEEFEQCFSELLRRLIEDDLGWTVTKNRIQSPGNQFGKDIQLTWIADGREYKWHFECKSHRPGSSLRKEEVMPKLYDAWRSEHRIDVWCLALAHIEPGQALDEFFAAVPHMLELPFRISVLSSAEHNLPALFACHRDLFERVYPTSPRLTLRRETRQAYIDEFGRYLLEESLKAIEPRDSRWALVMPGAPERMNVQPDNAGDAVAYLRGFTPCDWDAIAHDWAISRPSAEEPIVTSAKNAAPGVTVSWCVGPGGEGKTTAARAAAWELASDPMACVLWGDAEFEPCNIPTTWIEGLDAATRVVLFVDGTRRLKGIGGLCAKSRRFHSEGRVVTCVLVDRGVAFARSPVRRQLKNARARVEHLRMPSLSEAEASALVDRLEARRILHLPRSEADARLRTAAAQKDRPDDSSWLLPVLMEITDPKNRGFDQILSDVLDEVAECNRAALSLLLATALSHAARTGLPIRIAEEVAGGDGSGRYGEAREVLHSELLRQSDLDPDARAPVTRLLTYSGPVAESFVRLAWDPGRRGSLEETCHSLVESAGKTPYGHQMAPREFDLLNRIAIYLLKDLEAFELCAQWLDDWIQLDDPPVNFVAMHRLGHCLLEWMKYSLKHEEDHAFAEGLATKARAAFMEALSTAERVLAEGAVRPPSFERRKLDHEQRTTFHSWAILEGFVGTNLKKESALFQSAFLSILCLGPGESSILSVGNLALNLIELKRYKEAAIATSAKGELGGDIEIFRSLQSALGRKGIDVPSGGLAQLGELISDLAIDVLLPGLGAEDWPYTDKARKERLLQAIPMIRSTLPQGSAIDRLINACKTYPAPAGSAATPAIPEDG
jgi:hypothetical protein